MFFEDRTLLFAGWLLFVLGLAVLLKEEDKSKEQSLIKKQRIKLIERSVSIMMMTAGVLLVVYGFTD